MRSDFAGVAVSTNSLVISNQPANAPGALLTEIFLQPEMMSAWRSTFVQINFPLHYKLQLTEMNLSPVAAVDRTRFTTQLHATFF